MHMSRVRTEETEAASESTADGGRSGHELAQVFRGLAGLLAGAAIIYAAMIYLAALPQSEYTIVRLEMPVTDALTVVALTGATVIALRSWIRISDRRREPSPNDVQIILFRANLAIVCGLLATLSGFAAIAGSAPDTVQIGAIIAFVCAAVVALISVDTAQTIPASVVKQHRRRTLRQDWHNLMRVHDFWSERHRRRRWRRTVFAIALVRSALLAGSVGSAAFELVESRDGSWNSATEIIGDLGVLAGCTLIVLGLSLLALESWALSDWASLAMSSVFLVMFMAFLALACVQTIAAAEGTIGWAVAAGFVTAFTAAGLQVWPVCARSRSALLGWVAPTAFCAVIARRALCVMSRHERQLGALDGDSARRSGKLRRLLAEMRGVS